MKGISVIMKGRTSSPGCEMISFFVEKRTERAIIKPSLASSEG